MRQKQALAIMMAGGNVFLTGAPGAGKTYVLNKYIKRAQAAGKRVAVTASTGIAASHLGGVTIHSWSGLGILDSLSDYDLDRLGSTERLVKRYNATDVLVIDEISMLHGYRLDMINRLAKVLRMNDKPFGGMQVILVGDLFQLPPVSRGSSAMDFAHFSDAWSELDLQICYITEQHRQQSEDGLLGLLEAMRSGDVNEYHAEILEDRRTTELPRDLTVTRLYAHNVDVEAINQQHLDALDGPARTYGVHTKGSKAKIEQLAKGLLVAEQLVLKEGAEVMFVANNFAEGFVNGSRGLVIDFKQGLPVVKLMNGRIVDVELHTWSLNEDGTVRAEIAQLPLRLAWAITIHKSQGMSLDAAEVDLSRAFTPGMGYVALSRVRSLDGLYLKGINRMALTMHDGMDEFDRQLRSRSADLAEITEDIADAPEPAKQGSVAANPDVDQALVDKLTRWRSARAKADQVAPYMIGHNTTLISVAQVLPTTKQALLGVTGFGSKKVDSYGDDVIAIVLDHVGAASAKS